MFGVRRRDQCPRAPQHGSAARRDAHPGTPRLHAVPDLPHTAALGVTRRVPDNTPMVTFEHCQYSVPATLLGHSVWIRHHDGTDEVVICALDDGGPIEVARHRRATPGSPAIDDSHFPAHRDKIPGDYRIRARSASEQTFLALGPGAAVWLKEAAALGTERMIQKMAHAVELSALGRPRRRRLGTGSCRGARPLRHRRSRFHPRGQGPGPHPSRRLARTPPWRKAPADGTCSAPPSSTHPKEGIA